MTETHPWWKSAVVYQIYPRSFLDRSGDGIGDLAGIRERIDYLQWLGVDAIWLSPFYPSPMADFGYDVSNYVDVDPLFGTLEEFDLLVDDCHRRDLKVIVDWVPNHSSDQHPWFIDARSSRTSEKRDWYYWRDGTRDRPPNNWRAAFGGRAWTWDEATGEWYLHLFLPEQPDLNWGNPEVRDAMYGTLRFWLDRGVDGFRMDVIHGIGRDPALPDAPYDVERVPWSSQNDHELTHEYLREIRKLIDSYPGDRVAIGEVFLLSTRKVATYYGHGDELHLSFNFPPLFAPWTADAWRRRVDRVVEELDPISAWPTWVLSNHDNPRHRTRYGSEARARAAAVMLLTLRGTPFVYAGEEFGLEDAKIPASRKVDPGDRDGCRAPIPWDGSPAHGWAGGAEPWLPWPPEPESRNMEALRADPSSILHLYRRLLVARRGSPALRSGSWEPRPAPEGVLAYERNSSDRTDSRTILINFTETTLAVPVRLTDATVEVASDAAGEGLPYSGTLAPDQALILR